MDRIRNPYAPGAGTPPPGLFGRDKILEDVDVDLARIKFERASNNIVMVGLRGVGKTVLPDRMREDAEKSGTFTLHIEAPHIIAGASVYRGYDNIPSSPTGQGELGGRGTGFRRIAVKMSEGQMGYVDRCELPQGLRLTALAMAPDLLFRLSLGRAMPWAMSGSRRAAVQSYKGLNVGALFL